MIPYRWRGSARNFGDELNTILWPRLLPDFFDDTEGVRFLGIGSVLDARHPAGAVKVVAGSGYAGYEAKPRLDSSWIVHWVRGPRTAAALGLSPTLALGDPGALVPIAADCPSGGGVEIGFMPHFESAAHGSWARAAAIAGVRLIDPRDCPWRILRAIAGCRVLLSEALHGAIIADALRVPWIAIQPRARIHRGKWRDWSELMGMRLRFTPLPPSTPREWLQASGLARHHATRRLVGRLADWATAADPGLLTDHAARALARAARMEPQLSDPLVLERCQERMLDAVRMLAANPFRAPAFAQSAKRRSQFLQSGVQSAYQL